MSITNVKKRVAFFYDDKGELVGKKGFSKIAKTFDYSGKSFNVFHENTTFTTIKRWYWDLECYHYNINNPNPLILNKKCEPIMDSEAYNINLKTKVMRDLNDLSKPGFKFDFKTIMIILIIVAGLYLLFTGKLMPGKT